MLAEVKARLDTLSGQGAASVRRLPYGKLGESQLPSIQLLDGDETRPPPDRNDDEVGAPYYRMHFGVMLVVEADDEVDIPPLLTTWRAKAIAALAADRTTGLQETTLGGLVLWLTCVQTDQPQPAQAPAGAIAGQLLHFNAARPEAEMNAFLQSGF